MLYLRGATYISSEGCPLSLGATDLALPEDQVALAYWLNIFVCFLSVMWFIIK